MEDSVQQETTRLKEQFFAKGRELLTAEMNEFSGQYAV